jgi:tetratricopeptide (TPR) repeat protein
MATVGQADRSDHRVDALASGGARRRRRAVRVLLVAAVVTAGVELAGFEAVTGARSDAQRRIAAGDFAGAIAEYRVVATRSGALYQLARGPVSDAATEAEQTYLTWAVALATEGHTAEALAACDRVVHASLLPQARRQRAQIALQAARTAASRGRYADALQWIDEVTAGHAPADLEAQAVGLQPRYALDAGRALLVSGDGRGALAALDNLITRYPATSQAAQATALLPQVLLAAGRQALDAHEQPAALADLQRLVSSFGNTAEAQTARALLAAPQAVTGVLVHRDGSPLVDAEVRFGSNYRHVGSSYLTEPPFFYTRTDAQGDFAFTPIPQGGPYTLEVMTGEGWTTVVTADNQPAYQVTITPLTPVDLAFVLVPA